MDPDARPNVNLECDFWAFHCDTGMWRRICANTLVYY